MTNINVDRETRNAEARRDYDYDADRDRDRDRDRDHRRRSSVKMVTSTETRRSLITSEFWLTLAAAAAVVIAGYWDEANLRVNLAWSLAIGLVGAYVLSRGIAKAGSGDPHVKDLD